MRTEMTKMNIFPQFYFPIELFLRLEVIVHHSNSFMDCTHYYLQNICYHPNQDKIMIQNLLEFLLVNYMK
jgi:hypothetical protein